MSNQPNDINVPTIPKLDKDAEARFDKEWKNYEDSEGNHVGWFNLVYYTMTDVSPQIKAFIAREKEISYSEGKKVAQRELEKSRQEGEARAEYAEKLLDDVVCLYVKNLEDDTSLMKLVRKLMKQRIDEGKVITVAWAWLDERGRLTPPEATSKESL